MVQAAELGMNAVGVDISTFNALVGNSKVSRYNIANIESEIIRITNALQRFIAQSNTTEFDDKLPQELSQFNNKYFPVPEYKYRLHRKEINEAEYAYEKEKIFLPIFKELVKI
jgi:hypothetical protein